MRSAVNDPWPVSNRGSSTRLTRAPMFLGRSPRPTSAPSTPNARLRPSVIEVGPFRRGAPLRIVVTADHGGAARLDPPPMSSPASRPGRANSVVQSCVVNQSGDFDRWKASMPDGLQLPAHATLQRASLGGPFARGTLGVAPARVPLRNATTAPVAVASTSLAPIVDDASGLAPAFGSGALA